MFTATTATKKLLKMDKRIRVVAGGTSGGKTVGILQILIDYAQTTKTPELISVVSESFPHLRRGCLRDFLSIMQEHNYFKDERWSKTDFTYTFETGTRLEFFSADQPSKVRGPRRDVLFLNECNNVPFEAFDQLRVRTKKVIWLDFNPVSEFWFYTEIKDHVDHDFITLTYKDNEALDANIVADIESHKNNKAWWTVYGLGQLGEVEGRIYKDWKVDLDEIPHNARLERRGLDFGYSQDPAALVDVYYYDDGYILDEQLYQKGMHNQQIAELIKNLKEPQTLVIADSAEPKSIDEMKQYGINVIGATKGPGSINQGIQFIQGKRITVTKRSINLIKEYRNYLWKTDKDGRILSVPEGGNDHCFAPDTVVYTTMGKKRIEDLAGTSGYLYSRGGSIQRYHSVRPTRTDTETVAITFDDGQTLEVTPDHLLLQLDGTWVEAGLLRPTDMIQSVTYESRNNIKNNPKIQWQKLLSIGEVLRQSTVIAQAVTQGGLSIPLWRDTKGNAHTSHRSRQVKQSDRELRAKDSTLALVRSHDTREKTVGKRTCTSDKTINKEVARIKRGERVALAAWQESLPKKRTYRERLLSLSRYIYNYALHRDSTILPPELQNESKAKTVKRVSRGFCPVTYNLEVESTHCLYADGVVAHNCLDATRYAVQSLNTQTNVEAFKPTNMLNRKYRH